jgi:3D (Asp-Asp-Asp) domain-containing protein
LFIIVNVCYYEIKKEELAEIIFGGGNMEESGTIPLCGGGNKRWQSGKERKNKEEDKTRSRYYAKSRKRIAASVVTMAVLTTLFFIQYCRTEVTIEEEKPRFLLAEEGKALVDQDRLKQMDEVLKAPPVFEEKQKVREILQPTTVRISNPDLDYGIVRVIEEGSEGLIEHVVEIKKREGRELSRKIVSSEVIKPPVNRVLEYGGKNTFSRAGRIYEYKKVLYVNATAYCPGTPGSGCPIDERGASQCTGFYNDGYTYTGKKAVAGDGSIINPHIIAVDPAVIPLKAMVYLEGYGFAIAEDTGSAIKGSSIDLLFNHHDDAWKFGRKQLKVYLLANFE